MSAKEILLNWMETALAQNDGNVLMRTTHIHENVKSWGQRVYGKTYNATNYERRWRELRGKDKGMMTTRGITSAKVEENPEAVWLLSSVPGQTMTNHEARATASSS